LTLVLASASPRRSELLRVLGISFEVRPADLDESRLPDESAAAYVERLARAKAESGCGVGLTVVAADTTVVHEGRQLGKPAHPEEARAMLRRLQGDVHEVFTGVAVAAWDAGPIVRSEVDLAMVEFLPLTEDEIADYVDTGEPMDKAGSYALQGRGGLYIRSVTGSPFTVIGLPIHLLPRLFLAVGQDLRVFQS
jgi:nucleoside triphosphate pyrophosphatase